MNKDHENSNLDLEEKKNYSEKVKEVLTDWEEKNTTKHKMVVISFIFLVLVSFFIFRLAVSISDGAINIDSTDIDQRKIKTDAIDRKNDSINRVLKRIDFLKEKTKQDYIKKIDKLDSINKINNY